MPKMRTVLRCFNVNCTQVTQLLPHHLKAVLPGRKIALVPRLPACLRRRVAWFVASCAALACDETPTVAANNHEPDPVLGCSAPQRVELRAGESRMFDADALNECVRLAAGESDREYLVVAYSAAGETSPLGISAPFTLRSRTALPPAAPAAPAAPAVAPAGSVVSGTENAVGGFHARLREAERTAARLISSRAPTPRAEAMASGLIGVGHRRNFSVCANAACQSHVDVPAEAAFVGANAAVYLDDSLPANGFAVADYQRMGRLFDEHLYHIDRDAFGDESDIDGNGVVIVLVSRMVNRLCPELGGIVSGYFNSADLVAGAPGSNGGEVFHVFAPDPGGENGCIITREFVERVLPGTLSHEFQHMISFNQRVLMRGGAPEHTWLNEALSHYAEEIAGRRVPSQHCINSDCLSQFAFGDVSNAYQYLMDSERWFAVYPSTSSGRAPERGAAWLFLRWVVDHHGGDDSFTKALLTSQTRGAANVADVTGVPFDVLLGEWLLANYLDNLEGFVPLNTRLLFRSWNLRSTFATLRAQYPGQYPRVFPILPSGGDADIDHSGVLRGGSGRYFLVRVPARGPPADVRLAGAGGAGMPNASVEVRVAIARVR
jgi:hypothetical protein